MAKTAETGVKSAVFGCATINGIMAIEIRLNGEAQTLPDSLSVVQFLDFLGLPKERVAVERNRVNRSKGSVGDGCPGAGRRIGSRALRRWWLRPGSQITS